jgi:hypothetical protein
MADLTRDLILRWPEAGPDMARRLREWGVAAVLDAKPAFAAACREQGVEVLAPGAVREALLEDLAAAAPGAPVALKTEVWPGIAREPAIKDRGDETASASKEPWVDANGYWLQYLGTLYPRRPALIAPAPPSRDRMVPFDSLELALAEARLWGGNAILAPDPRLAQATLAADPKALEAWQALARTARWLREHHEAFSRPPVPAVTALIEAGGGTAEIANLLFRRNVSPALAAALPRPDPARRKALVAVELKKPDFRGLVQHAQAGTTVIVSERPPFSRQADRAEADREFFHIGRGRLVAYKGPIADPSEFALDVIDLVGQKQRAVRMWNAPAAVARATEGYLHLVNYGSPLDAEFPVRVQGEYARATLLRPEHPPAELKPARRGSTTEVVLSGVRRAALVRLEPGRIRSS